MQIKVRYRDTHLLECPKSRTLTTMNGADDVENKNSHILLVRMQKGTDILENYVMVSYKIKHTFTI